MKNKKQKTKKGLTREAREAHREEMQQIFDKTEFPVINKFSDANLDRENEKFQLLSGEVTSWKKLREAHYKFKRYIAAKKRDYEKTFPDELYEHWRRLNGWDKDPYQSHHKPPIFGRYTKLFIYGRLPREILPALEDLNDYIYPGVRLYKHFELITDQTYEDIKGFINNCSQVAKKCNDMYEFRVKYAALYGPPFQLSAFRDNDEILGTI
jgi:hypothetical protein